MGGVILRVFFAAGRRACHFRVQLPLLQVSKQSRRDAPEGTLRRIFYCGFLS